MHPDDAAWPLTGRDDELADIGAALRAGHGVLLAGTAGVGKSRLAREVLARQGSRRWVRASASSRDVPLGALAPLLGLDTDPPTAAADLLVRAHAALRAEPDAGLGVDDAHHLDGLSATLLHQAASEGRTRLVVTLRTGERAPDAVTALWKDGLLDRFDVAPLTVVDTGALLEAALGGRVESHSAARLHRLTSGNPLWLRHLVAAERRAGRFRGGPPVWRWDGAPRLDPALTALLADQLGDLPDGVRGILELLAVGEPLDPALLTALAGAAELDEAAARGLITVDAAGAVRPAHPLYGEAVLARGGPLRARRCRGRLVGALLDAGAATDDPLRLAVLSLDGDRPPDAALLASGAAAAAALADLPLAVRLCRSACAAGAGFETRLTLAVLLAWQFDTGAAERELALAAGEATGEVDRVRLALASWAHHTIVGRAGQADAALGAAARESDRAARQVLAARALDLAHAGRLAEAEAAASRALADPDLPVQARTYASWATTAVYALSGRLADTQVAAARALAAAAASPETVAFQNNVRVWEALALAWAGLPDRLRAYVDAADAHLSGSSFRAIFLPVLEGQLALTAGRIDRATALLGEFRARIPGHGGGLTSFLEPPLAIALGMAGDAEGAARSVRRAIELRHPAMHAHEPMLSLATAWATAATGAVGVAVREARVAASLAAASGQHAVEVLARHAAVVFDDRTQAADLARLARRVEGPRVRLAAAHAAALARGDVPGLLAAASGLESAGLLLLAAEAAAQAAARMAPTDATAPDVRARAAALAAACPGARTPALRAAARRLLPITGREREIAVLAGTRSNREIADVLGVSVRTVEGHIYRACVKLDLPGRAELAALVAGDR